MGIARLDLSRQSFVGYFNGRGDSFDLKRVALAYASIQDSMACIHICRRPAVTAVPYIFGRPIPKRTKGTRSYYHIFYNDVGSMKRSFRRQSSL